MTALQFCIGSEACKHLTFQFVCTVHFSVLLPCTAMKMHTTHRPQTRLGCSVFVVHFPKYKKGGTPSSQKKWILLSVSLIKFIQRNNSISRIVHLALNVIFFNLESFISMYVEVKASSVEHICNSLY